MLFEKQDAFFDSLPAWNMSVIDLIADKKKFTAVPEEWYVVVTDIKKSTQAVANGLHRIVNLVASGSIIAALNLSRDRGINIPFFFGGDGGTLIVPSSLLEPIILALKEHQQNTSKNFGLDLRVGHIPVAQIYNQQFQLQVAKVRINELLTIPVILGDGLQYAEEVIKREPYVPSTVEDIKSYLNLEGMECRWNRIPPPDHNEEVVSLLVLGTSKGQQADVFKNVLNAIESIYGPQARRWPISATKLQLGTTFGQITDEMKTKLGRFDLGYLIRNWIITIVSKGYLGMIKNSNRQLNQLVQLSYTLVLDGRISTVISGTSKQRKNLQVALEQMENEGLLYFGLYVSKASIMSCYVRDQSNLHIHFVDGSDGGYTIAAKVLKKKLNRDEIS
ncbi:MAG: DUF3095 family protein [Bacteroidota bacterium]